MIRSVLFVKTAILLCQPTMSTGLAETYARVLQEEGRARDFDPITVVAIVDNESKWRTGLVGGLNNQCVGLGQHCLHVYDFCRETGYLGERCLARKSYLLDGVNNLRETAAAVTRWRSYCRKLTGKSALFPRWLYGYQGHAASDPSRQCGMKKTRKGWVDLPRPALVKKVMRRRVELIRAGGRSRS